LRQVIDDLRSLENPAGRDGQARFGIRPKRALGIAVPPLRAMAKRIGRDHKLALRLWRTGIHEARILASMIDEPLAVTEDQMEVWARDFDSWDLVDQCCGNLFDKSPLAWTKAVEWSGRDAEFVKRAGFSLMAYLAVHDKRASDDALAAFSPLIEREAWDGRNFVKKAVNWALRQIGKRNRPLNRLAVQCALRIQKQGTSSARWIAADALRELRVRRPPHESRS
jgi:3-methyladenine DNA glycosylase AlkD